ncbi:GNAT family N-acetyltransferase [Streptomyces sp. NBC_01335]|uniref:GNAT family N-acetyltransferase n=1 Tax=Streptomyces sp. NBC_01335 TaxID=2903828 RepID=UPI002E127364|nr:GNAT family N-acetyltransferase [Streptomyces sp. NBC_01335]
MDTRNTGPGAVLVRRAVARDAKRLTRLVRASRAYEGPWAPMVEGYRVGPDYIETHRVFVAADGAGGPVLGFYSLVLDPGNASGPGATGELDLMFVADAAQGRGIGRRLIAHLREEAGRAGLDAVRVVSHPPSEGFYRSVGAERTGTAPATPPYVMWDRPELTLTIA